ncbi:MAG: AAA family ATPase [Firmicutes bacterium]|nr:AAA family ATPase [Bacillota bacterium]
MEKTVVAGEKTNLNGFAPAFPFPSEVTTGEKGASAPLSNLQQIPPIETGRYLTYIRNRQVASWEDIPRTVRREVLLRACRERGRSHPLLMTFEDFARPFRFLKNKTLTGFYNFYNNLCRGPRGMVIRYICEDLNIETAMEDWIAYLTAGATVPSWQILPEQVLKDLLIMAAAALGYSNPRMMSTEDLKTGIDFLQGLSLYSFIIRYAGNTTADLRALDRLCDEYGIPPLSFTEWLVLAGRPNFRWQRFPPPYLHRLLYLLAEEAGKGTPRMLKYKDFCRPLAALNNRDLTGLYHCYSRLKKDKNISTVEFICDTAGIPGYNLSQWLATGAPGSRISWESLSPQLIKEALWKAAGELGLKNPRLMDSTDFFRRFSFLNGKTLSGLYARIKTYPNFWDMFGIERPSIEDWLELICSSPQIRWEKVPVKIQREIILKAAAEAGLPHPGSLKARDFIARPFQFLGGKNLSGLYFHYAAKKKQNTLSVPEYILSSLQIPSAGINLKTGRINTIDSLNHRKYFDSKANCRAFLNSYLQHFSLKSLVKKDSMLRNAKKAGIYKKGLLSLVGPMNQREYLDFLYELLKNTPLDALGLPEPGRGDYRLLRNHLYALAGIKEQEEKEEKAKRIPPAGPSPVKMRTKAAVLRELQQHREILALKEKKYHRVDCVCLSTDGNEAVFRVPAPFLPGDILTAPDGEEFRVGECHPETSGDGYVIEVEAVLPLPAEKIAGIQRLVKDSNEAILGAHLEKLAEQVENGTVSPLLAGVLGLRKEKLLNPERLQIIPKRAYFNKGLAKNKAQTEALNLALALDGDTHTLVVVQGSPGTGKTTLITEIALQSYLKGENILILAKTNVAVDNILEKLMDKKIRVLRSGNNLHWKSNLPGVHTVSTANSLHLAAMERGNKVILGTPLGFYLDRNLPPAEYDLLIIDEASQMDIPETLFSLGFAKKCVMIGDHLQIPPYPIAQEILAEYNSRLTPAEKEKLQMSLFERLIADGNRFNRVFLDINYRTAHPEMVSFISDLIYDGRLSPNTDSDYYKLSPAGRRKFFPYPVEIVDTAGISDPKLRAETEINSTYYNLTEAMLCVRQVLNLLENGEKLTDIAVITPYKAQVEKVKEMFRENFNYFSVAESAFQEFIENRIYTIDSFQGREEEIVIISWVRSNYEPGQPRKTGFLKDFRRVNVSLSRARKKMILIGDYETLTNSDNLVVRYIFRQIKNLRAEQKIVL